MNLFQRLWHWLFKPKINVVALEAEIKQLQENIEADINELPPQQKRKRRSGYKVLEPLRRDIESTVIDVVERLEKLNLTTAKTKGGDNTLGFIDDYSNALSYLMGCDFHLINSIVSQKMEGGSKYLNPKGASRDFAEAVWPIDTAFVCGLKDGLAFSRVWTTNYASLRGHVKFVPQKCAWFAYMQVTEEGWWADLSPVGLIGNQWQYLDQGIVRTITDSRKGMTTTQRTVASNDEADVYVGMAMSIALSERYNWHVAFGNETSKSLRVLLPTNPLGCLALFKSREKMPDETRRTALRHWVTQHYRESSDRDIAYVRDHLRGTTLFNWRDFNCEILVSQFDLEKNEFFKDQADNWRAQRKHNRVRIKLKHKA